MSSRYIAAWLGWTLDAFDFTVFLLIMSPIAQYYGVPLIDVTAIFTVTLIMRLSGATASGWLADRLGRRAPLMISILWYSICNLLAGFSPSFAFLFVIRALLGVGMGAGDGRLPDAALAMESWPTRSRGFMSGVLQGSWGLGFALSAAAYGLLYSPLEAWHKGYGWRGMQIAGRVAGGGVHVDTHVCKGRLKSGPRTRRSRTRLSSRHRCRCLRSSSRSTCSIPSQAVCGWRRISGSTTRSGPCSAPT